MSAAGLSERQPIRYLGDGLLLRGARGADAAALAAFNCQVHADPQAQTD